MQPKTLLSLSLLGALAGSVQADGNLVQVALLDATEVFLQDNDEYGSAIAALGDLNGDGVEDLAVGKPFDDSTNLNNGAVLIHFLRTDGSLLDTREILGGTSTDILLQFGRSLANLGDVDGDGVPDLAVGRTDGVEILFLKPDGKVKSSTLIADGVNGFNGPGGDGFGQAVAALGDFDGNGVNDLVVGAPADDIAGANAGAVWLLFLDSAGRVIAQSQITEGVNGFTGNLDSFDSFGCAVANIGDLNNDGNVDLVVGARGDDDTASFVGAAYVVFLLSDGTVYTHYKLGATSPVLGTNLGLGDGFGVSVCGLGDVNGDTYEDVLIGAFGDDGDQAVGGDYGAAYVLLLNPTGSAQSVVRYAQNSGIGGLDAGDLLGYSVADVGDLDNDGFNELAVGSPGDDAVGSGRGAVRILFTNGFSTATIEKIGCDKNPDGSIELQDAPIIGTTIEFRIDNPLATQISGALSLVVLSTTTTLTSSGCGITVPGWNMDPNQAGELIVGFPDLITLIGPAWPGPLVPAEIPLAIPNSSDLIGLEVVAQGALWDPFAGPGWVEVGLTGALRLTVGSCP